MPYRICRTFEIESGHMLSKHPARCKFPHGHTRRIEVVLETDALDANDMVCDYKVLKAALAAQLDALDHAMCVNTDDAQFSALREAFGERIVPFESRDPTTEVLARMLHDACVARLRAYRDGEPATYPLRENVRVVRVRVWETSGTWAEFAPD
jgi:6-pyruvoyltetrahydropterin/6-carboxytetrahydropterin synthase